MAIQIIGAPQFRIVVSPVDKYGNTKVKPVVVIFLAYGYARYDVPQVASVGLATTHGIFVNVKLNEIAAPPV